MAQLTKKPYDRKKATLPMQEWEPRDEDLFWQKFYEHETANETLYEKSVEWLTNFRVNLDTIGFDRSVLDMPRIKGSAIVVDHQMTGSLESHLEELRDYKGTVLSADRALWKLLPYRVPEITANVDSSYLCISFFDRPDVREHMGEISAVFATTVHPLTIRAWHGRRFYFTPWLGYPLTETLSSKSRTPVMSTGGCVHNFLWILAVNLGCRRIGLLGIDNCYERMDQTEYPGVRHEKLTHNPFSGEKLEKPLYWDPVFRHYSEIHMKYIRFARERHGVETCNLGGTGVMHSDYITDMSLEDFKRSERR